MSLLEESFCKSMAQWRGATATATITVPAATAATITVAAFAAVTAVAAVAAVVGHVTGWARRVTI